MANLNLNIGSDVHCKGWHCGTLDKVVVDPQTKQVTDLIVQVEKGLLKTKQLVVPASCVEKADNQQVNLSIEQQGLDKLREYREEVFVAPPGDWEPEGNYKKEYIVHWAYPQAYAYPAAAVPMIRYRVPEGIPSDLTVIERGTPVWSLETHRIGEVDHLLVDRESRQVTHLVVNIGPLADSVVLPISVISRLTQDGALANITREQVGEFPPYRPRTNQEIIAEVRQLLSEASFDMRDTNIELEEGILKLSGIVGDVAAKRRAEAACRRIKGIVDVEDALSTDTGVMARVTAALAADPRTELAPIGVSSHSGVVTLRGQVDDAAICDAAQQVAEEDCDVRLVVNELAVAPDEYTDYLRFRPLAQAARAQALGPKGGPGIIS